MKTFTRVVSFTFLLALAGLLAPSVQAQSILDPTDAVVTYVPGSPPAQPAANTIGKWIRTKRVSWNTNNYKCYIINGLPFRLRYPKSYNPTANDGKKYPVLIFFHGDGEGGAYTDNEYSLFHGGQVFDNAVTNGTFDGYVFVMQTADGFWGANDYSNVQRVMDYMVVNNKLDPFRINTNGLSAGGAGTWDFGIAYPQYTAAAVPMSAACLCYDNTAPPALKYTPVWLIQGGLDKSPDPSTTAQLVAAMQAAGANLTYQIFPNDGHDTWDDTWSQKNFWPFLNNSYQSNPYTLFGRSLFCTGDPVNITIGLAPGFQAYQWRMNGTAMSATTNSIHVTAYGTYDARVERGGVWSDWSHVPVVVGIMPPTVSPNITIAPLVSNVIPALDTSHGVTLQVPTGYASYLWQAVGGSTTLSTTNTLYTTTPGQYHLEVTQQFGCSSSFSNPYTVVAANGPNPPSPAAGLIVTPVSFTSLRLDWNVDPSQQHPQTGFEVYQASSASGPYKIIALLGAAALKDTATGLKPGTAYYFKVRAVNATSSAAASNVATGTTTSDNQPPTSPTNLTITATTHSSVSLSWGASTDNVGVTKYDVYVNGKKVAPDTAGTSYTVYGLVYPNSYNFTVTARDFAGNVSPFSNQVTSEPLGSGLNYNYYNFGTVPTVLPNFKDTLVPAKTGVSTTGASLTPRTQTTNFGFIWQGYLHITTAGNYQFRTVSVDGSKVWLGPLGSNATPYSFTGAALVSNDGVHASATVTSTTQALAVGTYPIAIAYFHGNSRNSAAITLSWTTPASPVNFVTIPSSVFADVNVPGGTAPAVPTALAATATAFNKISLSWTDNSNNEDGFEIWRSTNATTGFTTVGIAPTNATSYIDSTLAANTQYFYELRSIGQYGQSAFSTKANATTQTLPGAPAAPTGLNARGTSTASSVTVSWTDNASNESSFQLYRSVSGNTNYLLLATLPANTVSYQDAGLFANGVYYYKIRAVNIGGTSAYSNEDSAHTADNLPTLTAITPTQFMRYGTQLQLNVQANDPDPGALTLSVTNLPAFGSFVTTGNGTGTITFNPAQADQNVYNNITVTVTDASGGSATQSFSLTVNNNFNPVIARPVANVTLNEKATATVNLSATDQNTTDVLTWSFIGLPGFASKVISGGSAQLNLAPGYADGGSYTVQARVDDGNQGFDTVNFTITVVPVTPPSTKTYVHFADGSAGTVAPAPWNNTSALPTQGLAFPNLLDQNGANSGLTLTITSAWQNLSFGNGTNTFGQTTGNNSGVYPDAVLGSAYYTVETPQTIQVSGLDATTKYNFTFFGSRGGVNDDRTSVYSVTNSAGTQTVSLQAANNTTTTVAVNTVQPNADGTVVLTLARGANAPYGYMNSVVIEKLFNDHTAPAKARNIAGQFINNNQVALTWTAAAYNANNYQVYRSLSRSGTYTLLNPGATNPTQASYNDSTISQNNTYYYYVTATNAYGVSPSSDTVTMAIPNLPPVITAVAPITIPAQQTANVAVTATDAASDVISLQVSGLPAFASFTDNGGGHGSLSLSPGTPDVGSYTGTLTATDNHGGVSSAPLNITVGSPNLRNIYINFNDGSASEPAQGAPWNNMNATPNAGAAIANLKDDQAASTGFGVSLVDAWTGANNVGPTTGNNSGVYPDNVMMSLYYDQSGAGSPRHVNITGLSSKGKYNVIFYAGRAGVSDNRITHYSVGSQSVQLNAASNTTQTVQLNGLTPDASGKIQVVVTQDAGASFAYLNAMQIQYTFDTTFYAPTNLQATSPNASTINLNWVSNAPGTTTGFELWRSATPTGPFTLLATLAPTVSTYSNTGLSAGNAFFYEVRAIAGARQSAFSNIASSSTVAYTVEVQFNDGSENLPQGGVWNSISTLLFPGFVLPNMINTQNQKTGINLGMVTNFTGYNIFGTTTGNNSGIFPDNVMNGFFYMNYGDTARMIVTGLDLTSTYNLNFFPSRVNPATSVLSTYQSNGQVVSLDATNNTTRTVQIAGLKPDSTGSIVFMVYNTDGGRAYLNALTIDGVPSAAEAFAQTPVPTAVPRTGSGQALAGGAANALTVNNAANPYTGAVKVMAFPNPFIDEIRLNVALDKPADKLVAMVIDVTGKVLFRQQLTNVPQGITEQKLDVDAAALPAGTYFVILTGLPDGKTKAVPLIKATKQ